MELAEGRRFEAEEAAGVLPPPISRDGIRARFFEGRDMVGSGSFGLCRLLLVSAVAKILLVFCAASQVYFLLLLLRLSARCCGVCAVSPLASHVN